MKKAGFVLLAVFLIALAFLAGIFVGRQTNHTDVKISSRETTAPTAATPAPSTPSNSNLININTASALELATLPNIGNVIAQRIVDYRTANGPFRSVAQLAEVEGIGEKRLDGLMEYVTVGG